MVVPESHEVLLVTASQWRLEGFWCGYTRENLFKRLSQVEKCRFESQLRSFKIIGRVLIIKKVKNMLGWKNLSTDRYVLVSIQLKKEAKKFSSKGFHEFLAYLC